MPLRIPRLPLSLVPACIVACFNPSQPSEDGNASADDTSSHDTGDSTGSSPTSSSNPSTTMTTADTDDTDGVTTQTTTDPTNGDECGANTECIPAAPEGWAGPFLRNPDGSCSGEFPNLHLTLGTDVDAPPASCECTCGNPTGLTCTSEVRSHQPAAVPGVCLGSPPPMTATNGVCGGITETNGDVWLAELPTVSGGNCTSSVDSDIVPAILANGFSLCGPASSPSCDGGACLTVEPESKLCIVVEGEADCPVDGYYGDRALVFADIDDSRGCTDCTCTPSGSCTNWTVRLYSTNICGGSSFNLPPDGGCRTVTGGPYSTLRLENGSIINQTCQPGASEATGSATATSLHTVCCTD